VGRQLAEREGLRPTRPGGRKKSKKGRCPCVLTTVEKGPPPLPKPNKERRKAEMSRNPGSDMKKPQTSQGDFVQGLPGRTWKPAENKGGVEISWRHQKNKLRES